jgi:signal transduction histidine kinase/ActR/RegA family two-component response regulator
MNILHEETRAPAENPVARVIETGRVQGLANHSVLVSRQGKERPIDDSAAPIRARNGRITGVVVVFRDITDQRKEELERERLTRVLDANNRRKDEFLAMLSHELRNPLGAINNALCLAGSMQDGHGAQWALDVAQRQVRHLSRLMDDLLDSSRITSGKIELRLETVDVLTLLDQALEIARPLISDRGHHLEMELETTDGLWINADPMRMEQILVNLLTNAAKYTENGGKIRIVARRSEGYVQVSVQDSGMGIHPHRLDEVFELFVQGDRSLARSEGGLGIGLTLVKKLITMHGGTVRAFSEGPGLGSKFVVELPEATAPTHKPAPEPMRVSRARSRRILVVDDNVDMASSTAMILKLQGHETSIAHGGVEALGLVPDFRPDTVLLDIGLPGMDGYEVASRLRCSAGGNDLLLIALSGYGQESDLMRSREAGFDHHLTKPVPTEQLLACLEERKRSAARASVEG